MSQPEVPTDKPINPAPPIGGAALQAKEELKAGDDMPGAEHGQKKGNVVPGGEYREKVGGQEDNDQTKSEESVSVNSTKRPRERQDTPWPKPYPELMAVMTQLANIQQQFADYVKEQRASVPSPERPKPFQRPNKLQLPTLNKFTTDPFVITQHLYALDIYLVSAQALMDPEYFEVWALEQCNLLIAKVGKWFTWSHDTGRFAPNTTVWGWWWKEKALDPNWVRQARNAVKFKRMEGNTPRHFDAFASSIRDYQHLLSSSSNPLDNKEVKRLLMDGLSSHMLVLHVENALGRRHLKPQTVSVVELISVMTKSVVACAAQLEAIQASLPALRPAPAPAPCPAQAQPAQAPIKAISTTPAPILPTAAEAQVWLDYTTRLPPGQEGIQAHDFLRQRGLCFRCRQPGQKRIPTSYTLLKTSHPKATISMMSLVNKQEPKPNPVPIPKSTPAPLVHVDKDRHTLDMAEAVGQPFIGVNPEGMIILGATCKRPKFRSFIPSKIN
ncbi:hypothetical protein L202_03405 [Cryptococcus amylolentus CBS 6039]|uniref:Uncharacterized protein n=1 Tax=Cryptococcus amylolentus CBS 6039 TaxID=1295533 RepID=A0A1E3HSU2_9TREE|nr:hypothetical protein L202_03405 [Cryptococcus amylolentus CBS 6039]ODN79414.1 hypothetical protein L202_03405 [Cryptococcus amylolentus CBS 6039]